MAYKLLELGLGEPPDAALLTLAETELTAQDYCLAMQNAVSLSGTETARQTSAAFIRRLALELLRQGIARESEEPAQALLLLRAALPHLNEKRAIPVLREIEILEGQRHG